jgi:hypothetical protein
MRTGGCVRALRDLSRGELFARPKVFSLPDWTDGQPVLDAFAEFNTLIEKPVYAAADKARMVELLVRLEIYRSVSGVVHRIRVPDPAWAWLRADRGTFDVDHEKTGIAIVAAGRESWTGWVELAKAPVNEIATQMTARVITEVGADVLCVVEVEDRPVLDRFNREMLTGLYATAMLIDGNDPRAVSTSACWPSPASPSRTCAATSTCPTRRPVGAPIQPRLRDVPAPAAGRRARVGAAQSLQIQVRHRHYRRQTQAPVRRRTRDSRRPGRRRRDELHRHGRPQRRPRQGRQDTPELGALYDPTGPLLSVYDLPGFDTGPRPGTFGSCRLDERFDHIVISRALAPHVTGGGIERHGLWGRGDQQEPADHVGDLPGDHRATASRQRARSRLHRCRSFRRHPGSAPRTVKAGRIGVVNH